MKSTNQIEDKIREGLAKKVGKNLEIRNESTLIEDLGLDSLDTFDLLFELEKEFDLQIPTQDALGFVKVQDIIAYIHERTDPK